MTDPIDDGLDPRRPVIDGTRTGQLKTLVGRVLFFVLTFVLLSIVAFWNDFGNLWGPPTSAALAVCVLIVHVLLVRGRVTPTDPVVWLPICIVIFYFGTPIAIEVIYSTPPERGYDPWLGEIGPPRSLWRGYAMALLTLVTFTFGLYLAGFKDLSGGPDPTARPDQSLVIPAYILTFGAMLMIVVGIIIVGGPSVVFGLYGDWWAAKDAGADQRFVDVGIVLASAGTVAMIACADRRRPLRLYLAVFVFVLLTLINVQKGARAIIITTGIAAGWCYTQRVGRLRLTAVLAAALVAFVVLPVIREWRSTRSLEETPNTSARDLVGETFYSMGSIVMIYGYVLDFVPEQRPYAMGRSFYEAFRNAIPNVTLSKGKSWATSTTYDHPASYITSQVSPGWFANGGGYGFAMGAEFYWNFGFPGVVVGVTLFGYFIGRVRNASGISTFKLILSALFFANTASFVRDAMGAPVRMFSYPFIALLILRPVCRVLFGVPSLPGPAPVDESADGSESDAGKQLPRLT